VQSDLQGDLGKLAKHSQLRATFMKESIRLFAYGSDKPLSIYGIVTSDFVSLDTIEKCSRD